MKTLERRFVELRREGRTLSGVAIVYGSEARIFPDFRERFQAGAFGDVSALDVILNVQHQRSRPLARSGGGGLELRDSAAQLEIRAELPQTRDADDTLALVESGILRGLSLEFHATRETWSGTLRTIQRARLTGLGIVDRPAYSDSSVQVAIRHMPVERVREIPSWL